MIIGQLRPVSFTQEGWKNLFKKASPPWVSCSTGGLLATTPHLQENIFVQPLFDHFCSKSTKIWPWITPAASHLFGLFWLMRPNNRPAGNPALGGGVTTTASFGHLPLFSQHGRNQRAGIIMEGWPCTAPCFATAVTNGRQKAGFLGETYCLPAPPPSLSSFGNALCISIFKPSTWFLVGFNVIRTIVF